MKLLVDYLYRIAVSLLDKLLLHKLATSPIFTTPNYEKNH